MGNGDEHSGDGFKYRGRSCLQLTGRSNYRDASIATHYPLLSHPDEAAEAPVGSAVAAWFWYSRGLNELADTGDYLAVTRKINGATHGLADRERWLAIARTVFT